MSPNAMLIYGGVVLCLVLLYLTWMGGKVQEGFAAGEKGPEFVMIYADWCGHCKRAKPDFEKFAANSPLNIGKQKVYVKMVNGDSEEGKLLGVEGYPTFRLYKPDGSFVEYKGSRSVDGYKEFLVQQLGA